MVIFITVYYLVLGEWEKSVFIFSLCHISLNMTKNYPAGGQEEVGTAISRGLGGRGL